MTDTQALKQLGVLRVLSDLVPGLEWRKEGGWHKCRCPFHEDTHASFKTGSRAPHRGQCFACGTNGDVVELAAKVWQCDTGQAMRRLVDLYPEAAESKPLEVANHKAESAHEEEPDVPPAHAMLYRRALAITTLDAGAKYLAERGVLAAALAASPLVRAVEGARLAEWSREVAREDGVTWAAAGGRGLFWKLAQLGADVLLFGTLATDGQQLAGLHVRLIEPPPEGPRYCQVGPAPRPWRVGPHGPGDIVICEGAIDALSWQTAGVQAMGLHGIETWRPWYARALPAGARPIIAMDRDPPGRRAQLRVARDLARLGWAVRVVDLDCDGPGDANKALLAGGVDALQAILATARPFELELEENPGEVAGAPGGPPPAAQAPGRGAEGRVGSGGPPPAAPPPRDPPAAAERRRDPPPQDDPPQVFRLKVPGVVLGEPLELVDVKRFVHLYDLIEWAHWSFDKNDEPRRTPVIQPPHRLTDVVIRWIETVAEGLFLKDSSGTAWLYVSNRLLQVSVNNPAWKGWLYQVGRIILTDREGKATASALEQYALSREHAPEPRPWMWHDRDTGGLALHLHDDGDQVAVVDSAGVHLERNGQGQILLLRDDATRPIRWRGQGSAAGAVAALEELVVRGLACEPAHRSLVVSWGLSALLRQRLDTKAILFLTGAAGAGKTEAARLLTTLWHGAPRVLQTTVAALWAEGERQPMVALDNQESAQLAGNEGLQQWLLVAATGAQRTKRLEGTSSGVLSQRADALALVTAIEPPALDELIQRVVLVKFRHKLHQGDYSSAAVIGDLQKARGRIIAGLLDLFASRVIPRLGELRTIMGQVPANHPKRRLGQHLALCALIADACHQVHPSIWGPGGKELSAWLDAQGSAAGELARGSDPVLDALQRLVWDWNRVVPNRMGDSLVRPAAEDARYRCTPLFRLPPLLVTDSNPFTNVEGSAQDQTVRGNFGVVVGFEGGYAELHADLLRVCRDTMAGPAFSKRIGTPSVLAARWAHNNALADAGWRAIPSTRSGRNGRSYRFVQLAEVP